MKGYNIFGYNIVMLQSSHPMSLHSDVTVM